MSLKHFEGHALYKYAVAVFLCGTVFFAFPQLIASAKRIGPVREMVIGKSIKTDSNVAAFRQYSVLRPYIGSSDVIMAPLAESWELPGLIGCKVVGVAHSNPFMLDFFERKLATEKFFSEDITAAERSDILSNYSVNYVLVPKTYDTISSDLTEYMKLVYKDEEYTLYTFK